MNQTFTSDIEQAKGTPECLECLFEDFIMFSIPLINVASNR